MRAVSGLFFEGASVNFGIKRLMANFDIGGEVKN